MKRLAVATRLIAAATLAGIAQLPLEAGAVGVYENAAAEPAFLLSARRISLRADLDFSRNDATEASIYRVGAAFPLRAAFKVGLAQTFVSVSDSGGVQSGVGDLIIRGGARAWHGEGWTLSFLGYLATGTTQQEYFPYSSKTLDVSASVALVDTLGDVTLYATAGRSWINRTQTERPVDVRNADHWRGSAGAAVGSGDVRALGGTLYQLTDDDAERWMWWGGVAFIASDALVLHATFQKEMGEEARRVSDWAASAGLTVRF
jgi:hypothetical protein